MKRVKRTKIELNVEKTKKELDEIERKRHSLPKVELTELEHDVLIAMAQGCKMKEINSSIKKIDKNLSFYIIAKGLLEKFEAFTLAHMACKAVKLGHIKYYDIKDLSGK